MKTSIEQACMSVLRIDLEKYIKILHIELEHLDDRVQLLIETYQKASAHNPAITEHVLQENMAVLQGEAFGFKLFCAIVDNFDLSKYETLEEVTDSLKQEFETKLKAAGLPRAAYLFAERKIEKVARYIQGSM